MLQVAIFVYFCESFLGIEPHFHLFRWFYQLKSITASGAQRIEGGVYFGLREGKYKQYLDLRLNTSVKSWKEKWFYIENADDSLSEDIDTLPVLTTRWVDPPQDDKLDQVKELLGLMAKKDIDGVGVVINFLSHQWQPLKERTHFGFKFWDDAFSQEVPEKMEKLELAIQTSKLFDGSMKISNKGKQKPYSLAYPWPEVSNAAEPSEFLAQCSRW